ncbi:MAG: 3-phosphoglycerate dehydrogenase [Flavobacteriales bacterium]|nr:3-phosphoglycerate dehydrogenase [Flavobacteriales bacterium]
MKRKILINDGLSESGKKLLKNYDFEIFDQHIQQDKLIDFINTNSISAIIVRSATKVRKDIIDSCASLKLIARGGVGMDNIDVDYAKKNEIHVINTPQASSLSVAELVFAHLFSMARQLFHSNRTMPLEGDTNFKKLKKTYSHGIELRGKKIGIIGFGRIGQEVAKIALGIGMKVLFYDPHIEDKNICIEFYNGKEICFKLTKSKLSDLLKKIDILTIHVPNQKKPLISKDEIEQMKEEIIIINTSRGGIVNERELLKALNNKKVKFAGIDVFENEPKPSMSILMHDQISLSPHIGASTEEAQERIGIELANQINIILNG